MFIDSIEFGESVHDQTQSGFRENLLISIGGLAMLFGLAINFVLKRLITHPFNAMIESVREYAAGKKSVRLDEQRSDDFGFLAKFINVALQSAEDKQRALEKALGQVEEEKRYIHDLFSHYLTPSVVNQLVEDKSKGKLGGEVRVLTALFADMSGFTALSETLKPEELAEFVNRYFSAISEVIETHGGAVERYIGDSVLSIFGASRAADNHAAQAVKAGIACISRLRAEQREFGLDLACRIGITGEMMIGNIGTKDRFSFTVMGDAANVASRLEGANKQFGTAILVGEETVRSCGDAMVFREIDVVQVVGRQAPVRIFEPLHGACTRLAKESKLLSEFNHAVALYRGRSFVEAATAFSNIADNDPVASVYRERALAYAKTPPPNEWSPITVLDRK